MDGYIQNRKFLLEVVGENGNKLLNNYEHQDFSFMLNEVLILLLHKSSFVNEKITVLCFCFYFKVYYLRFSLLLM